MYAIGMKQSATSGPPACRHLPATIDDMSKQQLFGWGAIALGLALAFAGLFELSTGEFMPGGYRKDASWVVSSALLKAFREWGPYLSGVIWLTLAAICYRMGIRILRDGEDAPRSHGDPL